MRHHADAAVVPGTESSVEPPAVPSPDRQLMRRLSGCAELDEAYEAILAELDRLGYAEALAYLRLRGWDDGGGSADDCNDFDCECPCHDD